MKKKQILFLFAASALFAACSSDEMPINNGSTPEGGEEPTEVYASTYSATSEEGFGVTIGDLSASATKADATTDQVSFELTIPDEILRNQAESYVLEADDFAIRSDGEYVSFEKTENSHSASYGLVEITRNGKLGIQINGLENILPSGEKRHEITFEGYLWIQNEKEEVTENGVIMVERFTWEDKLAWIGREGKIDATVTRGWDATKMVSQQENGAVLINGENGYGVRYNVYQGLQGTQYNEAGQQDDECGLGNTPYIKISVHVNRLDNSVESQIVPLIPDEVNY